MYLRSLLALVAFLAPLIFAVEAISQEQPTIEAKLARLLERFPAADADANGVLTIEEGRAFLKARQGDTKDRKISRLKPTHADLAYGPHSRNVVDVWLPENAGSTEAPIPMVVFFHGGGFVAGDKAGFDPSLYLEAGYAAASANYRFVDGVETLCPTPMEDATRAVQFLKSKAGEWHLDKDRFALSGSSAGAVIAMWIGYSDDMAESESEDRVLRESTRVAAVMPINGPTNLSPQWIRENLGGPAHVHGSLPKMFGADWDSPEGSARILESSPWALASSDDPPTFLVYGTQLTEVPLPESASTGQLIHHPHFGVLMEERLKGLGVPVRFVHGFNPRGNSEMADFLTGQFGQE